MRFIVSFVKQMVVIALLAVVAVGIWGTQDPTARDRLIGYGIPAKWLPEAFFLAKTDAPDAAAASGAGKPGGQAGGDGARPTGGQDGSGQASTGEGQRPSGGPAGGQAGGNPGQGGAAPGPTGAGGGNRGGRPDQGPPIVVTEAVGEARSDATATAIGTSEAARSVTLFPRDSGLVNAIHFTPGDRVEADALLVSLDDEAERLELERAEVALADAEATVTRYEALAAKKSISAVEVNTAQSALQTAKIAREVAALALKQREIRAPFSGFTGLTSLQPGASVTSSTAITTLDDRSVLHIAFRIPEAFAARIALGQTLEAVTVSRPGVTFTARISAIGSQIEPDSRTLVVEASLDNADDALRPGMSFFLTLRFEGATSPAIPSLSLQWDRDGSYVWAIKDGKAERRTVGIIERSADRILVNGEIAPGDQVVVEGLQRLRPGVTVAPANGGSG